MLAGRGVLAANVVYHEGGVGQTEGKPQTAAPVDAAVVCVIVVVMRSMRADGHESPA